MNPKAALFRPAAASHGSASGGSRMTPTAATFSPGAASHGQATLGPVSASSLPFHIIWPTVVEVRESLEGWAAGISIPAPLKNVDRPHLRP